MSEIPDEPTPAPAPEPESVNIEPTPEEIEAARLAAIAANDAEVAAELKRISRRGFFVAGASAIAGIAAWKVLRSREMVDGVPWPLRRVLQTNEALATAYFSRARLNPTYPPSRITRPARINGGLGLAPQSPDWKLNIEGFGALTLDDLRAFPKRSMITEFRCIEGWAMVAQWGGVRLADVRAKFGPPQPTRYVALETPDRGYYVGLDMKSAMHPQTLLAYELNGAPLTWQHGAPLRLAIPVKYGVKNIKRIGTIRYTDVRPADYWGERGYDWYAGL